MCEPCSMAFHCSHCAVSYRMLDWFILQPWHCHSHCSVFEFIFLHWFYVQDPAIVQVWAFFNPGIFLSVLQGSSGSRLRFPMQGGWNLFPPKGETEKTECDKAVWRICRSCQLVCRSSFFLGGSVLCCSSLQNLGYELNSNSVPLVFSYSFTTDPIKKSIRLHEIRIVFIKQTAV